MRKLWKLANATALISLTAPLSLGVVNQDVQVGDILTMKWGEPDDTAKTSTEQYKQAEIRVRVSPTPFSKEVRENYADSWRTQG